jgi:hypothetical protein
MLKVLAVGTSAWARSVGRRGLDDSDGDEIQHATGGIELLENPHIDRWSWLAHASTKIPGDTYDHERANIPRFSAHGTTPGSS